MYCNKIHDTTPNGMWRNGTTWTVNPDSGGQLLSMKSNSTGKYGRALELYWRHRMIGSSSHFQRTIASAALVTLQWPPHSLAKCFPYIYSNRAMFLEFLTIIIWLIDPQWYTPLTHSVERIKAIERAIFNEENMLLPLYHRPVNFDKRIIHIHFIDIILFIRHFSAFQTIQM